MLEENKKIFDASFTYFLIICAFIVVRILTAFNLLNFLGTTGELVLNLVIQVGLMLSLPIFLYGKLQKKKSKEVFKEFQIKKPTFNAVIISIILGIVVYILNIGISSFFNAILSAIGYEPATSGAMTSFPIWLLFVELFFTAVLPGICEEVAHRGMLLSAFRGLGAKKAILISGLLFGLMHLNVGQFFYASIIGFYLGFLALFTGNIIPGMIIHFMNNAINVYVSYATVNNLAFGNINAWLNNLINSTNPIFVFLILAAIVLVCVFLLFVLTFQLFKETKVSELKKDSEKIIKESLREVYLKDIENSKNELEKKKPIIKEEFILPASPEKKIILGSKEKLFMYTNIILTSVITILTLVWGML